MSAWLKCRVIVVGIGFQPGWTYGFILMVGNMNGAGVGLSSTLSAAVGGGYGGAASGTTEVLCILIYVLLGMVRPMCSQKLHSREYWLSNSPEVLKPRYISLVWTSRIQNTSRGHAHVAFSEYFYHLCYM
jgi:hypothetical protein